MLLKIVKIKKVTSCSLVLCFLKNEAADRLKLFLDESILSVDTKLNYRNGRWLAHAPENIPVVSKTKFPASDCVTMISCRFIFIY